MAVRSSRLRGHRSDDCSASRAGVRLTATPALLCRALDLGGEKVPAWYRRKRAALLSAAEPGGLRRPWES